ncbi:hypothetical protein BDR26DRAFT_184899 [Obelidium mucronatum]|nr:hypothetical protein BDR26DRAFT_184899 [Obelidium mucronatum]
MIILGSGIIGFSTAQWTQIHEYQELFDVRLVSLYDEPGKGASASYTSGSLVTSGAFTVSPTNVIASTNASLPVSYSVPVDTAALGWIYPATVLNAAAVTPVLSFSTTPSSVAAAVYSFSAKREQLSFFFQTAGWQASTTGSISNYTDAILISWVSKGLYGYVAPTVPVVTGPPVNQAVVFGNEFASASAAINGLRAYKIPFIEYDSTTSASFATLPLTANNVANFSMIILGSGAIGFSAAQWKQLYEYQSLFNVRLVSLYDVPGSGASASYTSTSGSANGVFTVSPLSAVGSADAGFPSSFTAVLDTAKYGGIYPANIVNTTAVTPILSFKSASNVISTAAAVYSFSATQQQLSFFYQIAGWDTSSQSATLSTYTVDVLISWVSKGLYTKALAPVVPHAVQVQTRALILSSGDNTEEYAQSTFQSYGLAYDTVVIAAADVSTNPLNLEVTPNVLGRYSVIVLANGQMLAGFTNGSYLSTLTPTQWSQLHNYQQYYGVRLVALNDAPNAASYAGKLTGYNGLTGCSSATLSVAPASSVFTDPAGLKSSWSLAAGDDIPNGSCNFPATAVDATAVTPVLNFVSSGIAAAVIDFGRNQQQMSFFLPCGSWSIACTTVGNIWFQWATRGTYTGLRRIYFTPQIDDVFLNTDGNNELGQPVAFRTSQADIQGLINWMPEINSRLPAGSNITIEMAYNGNGIMEYISKQNLANYHIDFDPDLTDAPLNWKKPLGTGKTLWPAGANHNWNKSILAKDPIYNFFSAPGNLTSVTSKFLWCSHTFTHEILNNNTYSDTINEVSFNFHLAELWGLDGQPFWSNKSMVTPGISGIFNGDALKALLDFGITGAVGDSSRPSLWNTEASILVANDHDC